MLDAKRNARTRKVTLLPAATKLGQGNIFTSVCQEFCPRGGGEGVCLSACWDTPSTPPPDQPGRPPPDQADPPGTRQTPPRSRRPPRTRQTPLDQADPPTPLGAGDSPRDQADPPRSRRPPGAGNPPPGSRLQHTVNERPVRILLECILVCIKFILHTAMCRSYCFTVL